MSDTDCDENGHVFEVNPVTNFPTECVFCGEKAVGIAEYKTPDAAYVVRLETELSLLSVRVKDLEEGARTAQRALKPFAARVYNDNGDHTVSDMYKLTGDNCSDAYFAEKKLRALLTETTNDA